VDRAGKRCAEGRQTVLVSATLTPSVLAACAPWCPDLQPVIVGVAPAEPAVPGAEHGSAAEHEAAAASPDDVAAQQQQPRQQQPGAAAPAGTAAPQWGWDTTGQKPLRALSRPSY